MQIIKKKIFSNWALLFQLGLLLLVYTFYSLRKVKGHVEPEFDLAGFTIFINYALGALIINYILLPRFLYKKKYGLFALLSLATIALVIVIEEGVIEQVFYPDTRALHFSSVLNNLVSTLPIMTILVGFKFAWDALMNQRELEQLKNVVKESELQFLKTQINPHFLFNNLNNLYAYSLENSPKTPEIILELSGVLRYMLYECKEEKVELSKEVNQLRNFINLSRLQIENRGRIDLSFVNIQKEYKVAPLIFSVFIENAVKHSSSSVENDIIIDVELKMIEDQLLFTCINSFQQNSNTDHLAKGIGLANVRKRLELLYPEKHSLMINKSNNLYEVRLSLTLDK